MFGLKRRGERDNRSVGILIYYCSRSSLQSSPVTGEGDLVMFWFAASPSKLTASGKLVSATKEGGVSKKSGDRRNYSGATPVLCEGGMTEFVENR